MFAADQRNADGLFIAGETGRSLAQFTDMLRLRDGTSLTLRFPAAHDADALLSYFRSLSSSSRYSRLMGAASELPPSELARTLHVGEGDRFAVIAEVRLDGLDTIVGEARYSYNPVTLTTEFGLSIADDWQGRGIGAAILANLECRAAALGAVRLVGDTFRNNERMIALARKSGFGFTQTPNDWRQVRFEKMLYQAAEIPCANWKQAALAQDRSPAAP